MVDEVKVNVMSAIDMMVGSLKRIILDNSSEKLILPTVLPVESKPQTGVVRLIRLTEKQYNNIYMVTDEPDYQEKIVGVNCHIMI